MKNILKHIKTLGIFSLLQIIFIFLCSALNIIFNSSNITTIILFVFNIAVFIFLGYKYGKNSNKKGLLVGLVLGLILVSYLYLLYIMLYSFSFDINKILYYTILIISSILGSIIGKNTQLKDQ